MRRRQVVRDKDDITDTLADWVPQHALHYAWACVDPVHGRGGSARMASSGEPWRWWDFERALDRDRAEISAFIAAHPEHADRLQGWLRGIEALALRREAEPHRNIGYYYRTLQALGYDSLSRPGDEYE
jgi:hypothetical protein